MSPATSHPERRAGYNAADRTVPTAGRPPAPVPGYNSPAAADLRAYELRARPCRHGTHRTNAAWVRCLDRYGVPGFDSVPVLEASP